MPLISVTNFSRDAHKFIVASSYEQLLERARNKFDLSEHEEYKVCKAVHLSLLIIVYIHEICAKLKADK